MTSSTSEFPELDQLFGVYLDQDYSYWGETLEAVIDAYIRDSDEAGVKALVEEIDAYLATHREDLDAAFAKAYGFDFDPALWGHTTTSFLAPLRTQLAISHGPRH